MRKVKVHLYMLIMPFALLIGSCSNNAAKADEPEVQTMDSVATSLDSTNKELDAKTKSLEESLEKVDKELEAKP